MSPLSRWLILGLAVVGLGFAGTSSYVHYRLITEPSYISPCDINAQFNCSELYLSRYGAVAGVPVALAGVIYFLAIVAIAAASSGARERADSAAATYIFALSIPGLASVFYLGWASYFVLHRYCLLCLGTYVAVIGLFITSGAASAMPITRLPGRFVRDARDLMHRPVRLLATLTAVVLIGLVVGCFPKEGTGGASAGTTASAPASAPGATTDQENFDKIWAQQPRVDLGIPADGAKVVVVKFNDWQCPACKSSYYAYKPILDKYAQSMPGAIKYVTKDYPLNSRCNFNIGGQNHPGACEASAAVRLAAERGRDKEEEMITWLFARQESLTPPSVEEHVKASLGITDFGREYARLLPDIKRDTADGGALQVQYTPTYYVNGVKAQGPNGSFISATYFDYAIQYELRRAGGK